MTAVPNRQALLDALNDPDPHNPLARQIEAALDACGAALNDQARRAGAVPQTLVLPLPVTEVEAFAIEVFANDLANLGVRVKIQSHS